MAEIGASLSRIEYWAYRRLPKIVTLGFKAVACFQKLWKFWKTRMSCQDLSICLNKFTGVPTLLSKKIEAINSPSQKVAYKSTHAWLALHTRRVTCISLLEYLLTSILLCLLIITLTDREQ